MEWGEGETPSWYYYTLKVTTYTKSYYGGETPPMLFT